MPQRKGARNGNEPLEDRVFQEKLQSRPFHDPRTYATGILEKKKNKKKTDGGGWVLGGSVVRASDF